MNENTEKIAKPSQVVLAMRILWTFFAIGLVVTVLSLWVNRDSDSAVVAVLKDRHGPFIVPFTAFALLGIKALFYVFLSKGHNWARILFLALSALNLPSIAYNIYNIMDPFILPGLNPTVTMVATISGVVSYIASVYALVLLFSTPATTWFNAPRPLKGG